LVTIKDGASRSCLVGEPVSFKSYNRLTSSELTSHDHENTADPSFYAYTIKEPYCTTRVTELAISVCKLNWFMVAPPLPSNTILGSNTINPALDSSLRSSVDAHFMASGTILIVSAEIQPEDSTRLDIRDVGNSGHPSNSHRYLQLYDSNTPENHRSLPTTDGRVCRRTRCSTIANGHFW
jgi:hypothetical protein